MSNFKVHGFLDIERGAKRGCVSLSITPKGYWSDVVSVYINRSLNAPWGASVSDAPHQDWDTGIKVASGGRDDSIDDIEASANLIEALQFARAFAGSISHSSLEAAFRQRYKERNLRVGGEE